MTTYIGEYGRQRIDFEARVTEEEDFINGFDEELTERIKEEIREDLHDAINFFNAGVISPFDTSIKAKYNTIT